MRGIAKCVSHFPIYRHFQSLTAKNILWNHLLIALVELHLTSRLYNRRTCPYLHVGCNQIWASMWECLGAVGRGTCLCVSCLTSSCTRVCMSCAYDSALCTLASGHMLSCSQICTYSDSSMMCAGCSLMLGHQSVFHSIIHSDRSPLTVTIVTQAQGLVEKKNDWNLHNCVNGSWSRCFGEQQRKHKHVSHDSVGQTLKTRAEAGHSWH